MGYKIDSNVCNEGDIETTVQALLDAASISTYNNTIVTQLGSSRYFVAIVYDET